MAAEDTRTNIEKMRAIVKAQEELLEAEAIAFFDLSAPLLAVVSTDGYFININEAWTESLDWTREELMGKAFLEFVHPKDREMTLDKIRASEKDEVVNFMNRFLHRDGSYVLLSWRSKVDVAKRVIFSSIDIEGAVQDLKDMNKRNEEN